MVLPWNDEVRATEQRITPLGGYKQIGDTDNEDEENRFGTGDSQEEYMTEEALQRAAKSYGGLTSNDTFLYPNSR